MFLERLLGLLGEKGITRNRLLLELKLGQNSFVNWEKRGTVPSGEVLAKIAEYFDVSVDYLLGKTETKKPAANSDELSEEERDLILRYRAASKEIRKAIDKIVEE